MEPAAGRQVPVVATGPQGTHGGDGSGHAGPAWQSRLAEQLHPPVQRQCSCLEAVQKPGQSGGKSEMIFCVILEQVVLLINLTRHAGVQDFYSLLITSF